MDRPELERKNRRPSRPPTVRRPSGGRGRGRPTAGSPRLRVLSPAALQAGRGHDSTGPTVAALAPNTSNWPRNGSSRRPQHLGHVRAGVEERGELGCGGWTAETLDGVVSTQQSCAQVAQSGRPEGRRRSQFQRQAVLDDGGVEVVRVSGEVVPPERALSREPVPPPDRGPWPPPQPRTARRRWRPRAGWNRGLGGAPRCCGPRLRNPRGRELIARGPGCWPAAPRGPPVEPVGAENRVTASDQRLRGRPTSPSRLAAAQHDRPLWPFDSRT